MIYAVMGLCLGVLILIFLVLRFREKWLRFKEMVDNTNDIMYLIKAGTKNKISYISRSVEQFCGYTPEEFYNTEDLFIKITHPDDYPLLEFIRDYPTTSKAPVVMRWIKKDGEIIWTEQRLTSLKNRNNKTLGIEGVVRNISHQKKEEFSLRETSKVFKELFHNTSDCIFLYEHTEDGVSGKLLTVNAYGPEMLGFTQDQILGLTFKDLLAEDLKEEGPFRELNRMGKLSYETVLMSRDGSRIPVEINSNITKYQQQKVILAIARNVSIRKKMEIELLKSQKLESVGILAGGLAHDFNNYLSVMLGNVNLAANYMEDPAKAREILKDTEKAILKATGLTHQLLTFAKGGMPIKTSASISDVLKETAIFDLRGVNIECLFEIPDDLWLVEFDVGQINQVFNNLIINARQAMPDGGALRIKGENILLKDDQVPLLKKGRYIKITLTDNGIGIPSEILNKVFDPFFTTKENGSGLGLALSYSIIRKHQGHMTIESRVGKGTTFYIYLPALDKAPVKVVKKGDIRVLEGGGRVLVMDDQIMIAETLGKMLYYLGYEADLTGDGTEAIAKYQEEFEKNKPYDLVLMDLTVQGGMGGAEAVKKILEIDPAVKAVVSSGYSTHPIMADYEKYGFKNVICKPYTIKNLNEVVSETIINNK